MEKKPRALDVPRFYLRVPSGKTESHSVELRMTEASDVWADMLPKTETGAVRIPAPHTACSATLAKALSMSSVPP